jgi:Protein of unknown function (DUF3662)/FHA domain
MSVLKSLENKIAGAVEGTFSRVFRSEVRPVEIARKLAREMEEHQSGSLSRVYVPNEYRVFLSPRDRERFIAYEDALAGELGAYLLEHARRERFALLSAPVIQFETDRRLGLGQFGIATRVVDADDLPAAPAREEAAREQFGQTMVFSSAEPAQVPQRPQEPPRSRRALLLYNGARLVVGSAGATIGRSRECEVVVDDANVSRRHAELRPRGGAWVLTDLGSTNGTRLDGRRIERPEPLEPGDRIEVGASVITFDLD